MYLTFKAFNGRIVPSLHSSPLEGARLRHRSSCQRNVHPFNLSKLCTSAVLEFIITCYAQFYGLHKHVPVFSNMHSIRRYFPVIKQDSFRFHLSVVLGDVTIYRSHGEFPLRGFKNTLFFNVRRVADAKS